MNETGKPVSGPEAGPETDRRTAVYGRPVAEEQAATLAEARRNLLYGMLWCVGGLAFSFLSYYFTEAGGRFVVATGAILWGAVQALRGLFSWLRVRYRNGEYAAFWRMAAAALATLLLLGYLTSLSMRITRESGLVDTEQTWQCDGLGVRFTVPEGYTSVQEETEPETDSTWTRHFMFVSDGRWEFSLEGIGQALSPEVESVADITDYCMNRDSSYYDGGILVPTRLVEVGGREMLYSAGYRTEYPDDLFTLYDLKQGRSLLTVGIVFPKSEYGKEETVRRVEELLGRIELTAPEPRADSTASGR